jgi:hypothetical protein
MYGPHVPCPQWGELRPDKSVLLLITMKGFALVGHDRLGTDVRMDPSHWQASYPPLEELLGTGWQPGEIGRIGLWKHPQGLVVAHPHSIPRVAKSGNGFGQSANRAMQEGT